MTNDKTIDLYIKDGARVDKDDPENCNINCKYFDGWYCALFEVELDGYDIWNCPDCKPARTPECIEAERIAREIQFMTTTEAIRRGNIERTEEAMEIIAYELNEAADDQQEFEDRMFRHACDEEHKP